MCARWAPRLDRFELWYLLTAAPTDCRLIFQSFAWLIIISKELKTQKHTTDVKTSPVTSISPTEDDTRLYFEDLHFDENEYFQV